MGAGSSLVTGCSRSGGIPRFEFTALDGQRQSSHSLRGQVVLVSFWATTCSICVADMPQLVALHQRFAGPGFKTLAVAMSYDPPTRVADFAQSRRLPFDVVIDNTGAIAAAFGDVRATPTTALLDSSGHLRHLAPGKPEPQALAEKIAGLLAERQSG